MSYYILYYIILIHKVKAEQPPLEKIHLLRPVCRFRLHAHQWNIDSGVCEKTRLLVELLPCNPSAETAIQPRIWCSESLSSY